MRLPPRLGVRGALVSALGTSSESKKKKEQDGGSIAKKRKYDSSCLSFEFTSVINAEMEKSWEASCD